MQSSESSELKDSEARTHCWQQSWNCVLKMLKNLGKMRRKLGELGSGLDPTANLFEALGKSLPFSGSQDPCILTEIGQGQRLLLPGSWVPSLAASSSVAARWLPAAPAHTLVRATASRDILLPFQLLCHLMCGCSGLCLIPFILISQSDQEDMRLRLARS